MSNADYLAGCFGKASFPTRMLAQDNLDHLRGFKRHVKAYVYRCKFCPAFHIGSESQKTKSPPYKRDRRNMRTAELEFF